jgi:nucleoside-diphosphate-sugar epimerase
MRALVTGATGFIGSKLCEQLTGKGFQVRALALPEEDAAHIQAFVDDIRRGDLTRPEDLSGICDGIDVVFHLAARVIDWGSRSAFYSAILDCTRNLLEESVGRASRFVYLSSIAACGLGQHLKGWTEETPPRKTGVPYGDAKLDTEAMVRSRQGESGLEIVIVRPANVIGPGSVWVRDVVSRIKKTGIPLLDGGRHGASLIEVSNLVDGIILAGLEASASGQTYFMRDEWDVTWKRYLTDLAAMVGRKTSFSVPFPVAWHAGAILEMIMTPLGFRPPLTRLVAGVMGRNNDVDASKARRELGWRTTVSYKEAMEEINAVLTR